MADRNVETTASLEALVNRSLVIISGKGGTGKSLVAACLALQGRRAGKRVLVVECAARSQLMPFLGTRGQLGPDETVLRDGIWGANVTAQDCFREYIVKYLGHPRLYETVFKHQTVQSFINAIPGLGESMILGRLLYSCRIQKPRAYDLVIFDAPASGHFLSMMQTPDTIIDALRIGPLVTELKRIREFFQDKDACAGLFVTTPEELVVSETLEFLPLLSAREIPLHMYGVVINRVVRGEASDEAELERLARENPELTSVMDYWRTRTAAAKEQEAALVKGIGDLEIFTLPEFGVIPEPLPEGFELSLTSTNKPT